MKINYLSIRQLNKNNYLLILYLFIFLIGGCNKTHEKILSNGSKVKYFYENDSLSQIIDYFPNGKKRVIFRYGNKRHDEIRFYLNSNIARKISYELINRKYGIKSGESFDINGNLTGKIINGNGEMSYYYDNGYIMLQEKFKNFALIDGVYYSDTTEKQIISNVKNGTGTLTRIFPIEKLKIVIEVKDSIIDGNIIVFLNDKKQTEFICVQDYIKNEKNYDENEELLEEIIYYKKKVGYSLYEFLSNK